MHKTITISERSLFPYMLGLIKNDITCGRKLTTFYINLRDQNQLKINLFIYRGEVTISKLY